MKRTIIFIPVLLMYECIFMKGQKLYDMRVSEVVATN